MLSSVLAVFTKEEELGPYTLIRDEVQWVLGDDQDDMWTTPLILIETAQLKWDEEEEVQHLTHNGKTI